MAPTARRGRDVEFYPEALRAIRLLIPGRSASSVADDAKVPRGSYWGYEHGNRTPPADHANRIAEVLRVPVVAFYRARGDLQEIDGLSGSDKASDKAKEVAGCRSRP